jgi:hypothetical protein
MKDEEVNSTMDWRGRGYDANLVKSETPESGYIKGSDFAVQLDELLFNRMIRLKNLPPALAPQGNEPGKIYYDYENLKYKMWVGPPAGWVDIIYTSTSTSTTTTSSSSTSTSTTSSSTSTTTTSSSSTSTSTTL